MLTGDAKWGALYGCDAFILPSHQENFGIAVVEALACGKPVLISNKVNIWREIEKDRAGTVRDDTVSGTKRLLDYWLQGAASYSPLKCFEENFHIKSAALKFINVLNSQRTLTGSLELMSTFSDDGTDKT
jgi:glycosyltransferase involved in cell wall biosynthesis